MGCTINLCSALLSALLSTLAVRSWALRASSGSADSDDVEASSAAAAEEESARYAKALSSDVVLVRVSRLLSLSQGDCAVLAAAGAPPHRCDF